ncbi:hypothetical protein [Paenibacillus nanensis]|uniref:hypothetical protein n=1 Tax=Paenibacillus nanensis TaxID=393251 RepID=UPI0013C2FAAD|nr:hypothetical protein [Paenibacillus nanensis]
MEKAMAEGDGRRAKIETESPPAEIPANMHHFFRAMAVSHEIHAKIQQFTRKMTT